MSKAKTSSMRYFTIFFLCAVGLGGSPCFAQTSLVPASRALTMAHEIAYGMNTGTALPSLLLAQVRSMGLSAGSLEELASSLQLAAKAPTIGTRSEVLLRLPPEILVKLHRAASMSAD